MPASTQHLPSWLFSWMQDQKVDVWGAADLRGFSTPRYSKAKRFPSALSWALPMTPHIMASIQNGPNQNYADEYARVNTRINELAEIINELTGNEAGTEYGEARKGDILHSLADISKARELLGYEPSVGLKEGLSGLL